MSPPCSSSAAVTQLRLIAFYLPQFHPTPENDEWWGKGFTEWSNVTKATPLFDGHYQPHLPTDFGFYDLRLGETRRDQIGVAKQYGLDGFCYHYYWFSGRRILHQPVDDMLADRDSDMPFCLCWANENWTRRWDGAAHEVLLRQKNLPDDNINFIRSLAPFLKDSRYIRVGDAPIVIVYRPQDLPDPKKAASIWREYCHAAGIGEIHLCAALTHGNDDYLQFGFDSGVQFPPHNASIESINRHLRFFKPFRGRVLTYDEVARYYMSKAYSNEHVYRCVVPCWDNTARANERALVVLNSTPANYEYWLSECMKITAARFSGERRLVFINAWNEWAEGCHLEPDRRYQREFLEATWRAKHGMTTSNAFSDTELPNVSTNRPRKFFADLGFVFKYHFAALLRRASDSLKRHRAIRERIGKSST